MSRVLYSDELENDIRNLINDITETLKNQYKHWQKYGINGYPNFKALETGFKPLQIVLQPEDKWVIHYNKQYVGMINIMSLDTNTLFIIKVDTKELGEGKKIHYQSRIGLNEFLDGIYDITFEQKYALERVLFEFEA